MAECEPRAVVFADLTFNRFRVVYSGEERADLRDFTFPPILHPGASVTPAATNARAIPTAAMLARRTVPLLRSHR